MVFDQPGYRLRSRKPTFHWLVFSFCLLATPAGQRFQHKRNDNAQQPQRCTNPAAHAMSVDRRQPSHHLGGDRKSQRAGTAADTVIHMGMQVGQSDNPCIQQSRHLDHKNGKQQHRNHRQDRRKEQMGHQHHRRNGTDGQDNIHPFMWDVVVADIPRDRLCNKGQDTGRRHHCRCRRR